MKTRSLVFVAIFTLLPLTALSAEIESSAPASPTQAFVTLPNKMVLNLYPDRRNGERGPQLLVENITQSGNDVVAKMTMYGRGRDRCVLNGQPAKGTFDGTRLVLKAQIAVDDNLSCDTEIDVTITPNGGCHGSYKRPLGGAAGIVRCD